MSKAVRSSALQIDETTEQPKNRSSPQDGPGSSSKQEKSARSKKEETFSLTSPVLQTQRRKSTEQRTSDAHILCISCGIKTEADIKDSMRFSFSERRLATGDFLEDNLLGEGGYAHVYKGKLKDGQLIAAKVWKEASIQGCAEFHSEIYVLSRHKYIVMQLRYCCKENTNILVYEYICNKSPE